MPDSLRAHERELIDRLAKISANVVDKVTAHNFSYLSDATKGREYTTDEASLLRVLKLTHTRYLRAVGYPFDEINKEAAKRAAADLEQMLVLSQTVALDRHAAFLTKTAD